MKFLLRKLENDISAFQIFQGLRMGSQIIIGILLAKSGMSKSNIAIYVTFLLASGASSFFWISGLMNSLVSLHPTLDEIKKKTLIFNAFILIVAINFLVCFVIVLNNYSIQNFLVDDDKSFHFFQYLLIYILLINPSFLVEHYYLVNKKYRALLIYAFSLFPVQLALVVIPAFMHESVLWCIIGLVIFSAIKFIWLLFILLNNIPARTDFKLMKNYLLLSTPLIISILLTGSYQYADGIIISKKLGHDFFAIYNFGAQELPFILVTANAMSVASIPLLSRRTTESFQKLRSDSLRFMHIFFPLTLIFLLTSQWTFPLIFNVEFKESHEIFNVYLLLIISRLVFPQSIATALQKTRIILLSSAMEITLNIALSLILVNQMGIVGVAYATVIAFFADKFFLASYLRFKMKINPNLYIPLTWWTIYSSVLLGAYLIITFLI